MPNFKSQAKRQRELAKLNKRQAKDQKRALRRAERSGVDAGGALLPTAASTQAPQSTATGHPVTTGTASARKPTTLAEAVERWKKTKVEAPKRR